MREKKIHILFIADCDDKFGAPHSLYQMVEQLSQMNASLKLSIVLPTGSSLVNKYAKLGCDVYCVPYSAYLQSIPSMRWGLLLRYPIRAFRYFHGRCFGAYLLSKKMDISSVDIIHANSSREDLGAILANRYSKPLVWHIREFGDLDYPQYSYRRNYIDLLNKSAAQCIAISEAVRSHWIKKGVQGDRIIRIYNGVESNVCRKRKYRMSSDEPMRFLMMGSLSEAKGQLLAVEALGKLLKRRNSQVSLDVVGSGSRIYTERLKRKIHELGLGSIIRLLGYRKDYYQNIKDYDCGIMCSRSEGFGRVTAEYMMAGLPVIASNTGANPELVNDGETGLLYKQNDINDLSEKMLMLIEQPIMCEQFGKKAAQIAEAEFSSQRNAENVYHVYKKILKA